MAEKHETDWDAIKAVTGLDDNVLAVIQKNWQRGPQTAEEVRAGVLAERKRREDATTLRLKKEQRKQRKSPQGK